MVRMLPFFVLALAPGVLGACLGSEAIQPCSASKFTFPEIDGTTLIDITAVPTYNYTAASLPPGSIDVKPYTIDFCNVSVTYTHPGTDDAVNVQVWLPPVSSWNGRLQSLGGGGYSASFGSLYMTQAVGNGYIALDTDASHPRGTEFAQSPKYWALESPGNVNTHLVEIWGSTSLHEMAIIGKTISTSYYGAKPNYSYFTGCSGGGRQAMMIAQRYAEDFDGILAVAPAINIEKFIPAGYWATQVMQDLGVFPSPCEIDAFTKAAVDACDALDGAEDGVISLPSLCNFEPHSIVGQNFSCNGTTHQFTDAAATIVQAAWTGPRSADGETGWFGLNKDASLTATYIKTECASNNNCTASSADLLTGWVQYFLAKNPNWDASAMSKEQFIAYLQQSERDYEALTAANDPDLSAFREAGGKLITWHGLADEAIPPDGTIAYMEDVLKLDPESDEYIRFFEAPGVGHCYGGVGAAPDDAFQQLVSWVENGTVPITLAATDSTGQQRELCPFPLQQVYVGGNSSDSSSYECAGRVEKCIPASQRVDL